MKKLSKIFNSLQTKLIASFILLIVVIAGGTFLFTFTQTKKALLEITREDMLQIIGIASTQFSADEINEIRSLKAGDDATPVYLSLVKKLQTMRALSPNVINFYVMQLVNGKFYFLVDDAPDDPALIGQEYL